MHFSWFGELPYLWLAIANMYKGTLIQHLEAIVICEDSSTDVDGNMVILYVYSMMKGGKKVEKSLANTIKSRQKQCKYCKKFNHKKDKCFGTLTTWKIN
jgi:tRNA 2-selenouridine synthase SelU